MPFFSKISKKDDIGISYWCQQPNFQSIFKPKVNPQALQIFQRNFPEVQVNKPLDTYSTFGIGGPADLFYDLKNLNELSSLVKEAKTREVPYMILGGGSNTIFADEGFRGLVIHITAKNIIQEEGFIVAEAGALLSQVVQFGIKFGFSGMEKLMGLPGTIGGAVRGNAGAYGTEIKSVFYKALLYNEERGTFEAGKNYFEFGYRTTKIKKNDDIILKVYLELGDYNPQGMAEAMDILKNRVSKQPKGKSTGSFFKNPGGGPGSATADDEKLKAGYLLEQAGCKGLQVGKVKVSDEHANWLMNVGGGTQKDVLELSKILQEKVQEKFGIILEREVQLVSETGLISNT